MDRIRREVAQQALVYESRRDDLVAEYGGRFVALSGGAVIASHPPMDSFGPRGGDAERTGHTGGIFLKQVAPLAEEREHLALYAPIAHGPAFLP